MKIAFDIGGVLSKYPHTFRPMIECLTRGGAEVLHALATRAQTGHEADMNSETRSHSSKQWPDLNATRRWTGSIGAIVVIVTIVGAVWWLA